MAGKKRSPPNDLIGQKFGRLTVIDCADWHIRSNGTRNAVYKCLCDCGIVKNILAASMKEGLVKSCGCLIKETSSINGQSLAKENATFNALIRAYKKGAYLRNLKYLLSNDEFYSLTKGNCYYCNKKPNQIRKKQGKVNPLCKDYIYNGIDRINSNLDYTFENCVSCCKICNMMKKQLNKEDFLNHIVSIYNNLIIH